MTHKNTKTTNYHEDWKTTEGSYEEKSGDEYEYNEEEEEGEREGDGEEEDEYEVDFRNKGKARRDSSKIIVTLSHFIVYLLHNNLKQI